MTTDDICFDCLGDVNPCEESVCRIQRLLNLDEIGEDGDDLLAIGVTNYNRTYRAFQYEMDEFYFLENIDSFFMMAKQRLGRLERSITDACNVNSFFVQGENSGVFFDHRLEICTFLRNLRFITKRGKWRNLDCQKKVSTTHAIMTKFLEFILRVGQMSTLPRRVKMNMATEQGNQSNSSVYHLTHLHLDIKWYSLLILTDLHDFVEDVGIMSERSSCLWEQESNLVEPTGQEISCYQYVNFILWDLISLSLVSFHEITIKDYFISSPFSCSCCRDLWVFMIQFLDKYTKQHKDSFWITLHGMFQTILQDDPELSHPFLKSTSSVYLNVVPDFCEVNRLGFCWWLLLHISPLYLISENGDLMSKHLPISNYFEIVNLLKKSLNSDGSACNENQMRCYLRCCISICKFWDASSEVPLLLWEHFFKRLNDLFMDVGEVTLTCSFGKSSLDWIRAIRSITEDEGENREASLNSYQLFLRLVAFQLKKSANVNSLLVWRQLKGRIFSKFHPRKIAELNATGLHNCFCLFLTLASIAELDDVVGKVCDLLEMMAPTMVEHGKHCIIWRAMFALMIVCEERDLDLALPARKMVDEFNKLSKDVVEKPPDNLQSHMASELLTVYMEGLQDVFEHSSSLNLSEYILIAPSFTELLSKGTMSDLQLALTALQVILARLRMVNKSASNSCSEGIGGHVNCISHDQHEALADALWCYVFPIIKEKALADSPLGMLADVASGLTLLVVDMPPKLPTLVRETLTSLMNYFCFELNCGAEYLSHCLSQPHLVEQMESEFPDCQAQVLRVWIRLALQLPITNSQMQELTRFILKLPETAHIFAEAEHPIPNMNTSLVAFFQALDVYHSKNLDNSLAIRQKIGFYLSDVALIMDSILKVNRTEEVANLYLVVGELVRHIAILVYVRSKPDCLLNRVIRTMLLPPTVYNKDKIIPTACLNALRVTLPLFMEGLFRVGCRRDAFIGRTVKEIFVHYLPRYPLAPGSALAAVHPLVDSLVAVTRLQAANSDLFTLAVEAVRDNYLTRKGALLHLGVGFINNVLMRCTAMQRSGCCHLLVPSLLKSLMFSTDENDDCRRELLDLLKMLVTGSVICDTIITDQVNERFSLSDSLGDLVKQQFGIQPERLFRFLMLVSNFFPDDVVPLVPLISDQLNVLETKKGNGFDEGLRMKYKHFLTNIERVLCERRTADMPT